MKPHRFAAAALLGIVSVARLAAAHDEGGQEQSSPEAQSQAPSAADQPQSKPKVARAEEAVSVSDPTNPNMKQKDKTQLPWHGSALLFDQSVTTPTVGVGADYQSSNQVYEWWFAIKPRYALYESKTETVSVSLWMNLYLELTNSDTTTTEHELVLGPTWLSATYGRTLIDRDGYRTSMNIGPRVAIPTDKASRNSGQIMGLGASAGLSQSIPLAGESAPSFNNVRFGISTIFSHPISQATTAINSDVRVLRQNITDGRTVVSDMLRGSMNVANSFTLSVSGDLRVTPKLGFSLSYSFLNSWIYQSKQVNLCTPLTGCVEPTHVESPTTFRASNWFLASLDYDATDEFSVSFGYYNLASQTGPDAQRRNPLWSPDARIFFTVSANLDAIYQALTRKPAPTATASVRP